MDIEKEREAFESWFESRYGAHFMQFALDLDFYVDKHTQTCWEAWQAAKAQAVPEGFVLVPKINSEAGIESMAMRYRHDFPLLDENYRNGIKSQMRQLYEEAIGLGFYTHKKAQEQTNEQV